MLISPAHPKLSLHLQRGVFDGLTNFRELEGRISGSEGIGNHLSGFDAYHVNGAMPMSERKDIMIEFDAAPKAVISNAKCLTEGVNVPAVDMVAFLTPKRSRVDIVQATGRAMRKAGGKIIEKALTTIIWIAKNE